MEGQDQIWPKALNGFDDDFWNTHARSTRNTRHLKNSIVSAVPGNGENAVKSSACWIYRPTGNVIDNTIKDGASYMLKRFNYVDLQGGLKSPNLDFMRPFGCPVTILNTLDHLGKFEGKADEGFLVGYFVNSPEWLFDIDSLTKSMNYESVITGNQSNDAAGIEINSLDDKDVDEAPGKGDGGVSKGSRIDNQERNWHFDDVYDDREVGAEADTNNLELLTVVSHIPTTRVHKDHPKEKIIRDLDSATQTRRMISEVSEKMFPGKVGE
nr:Gag/Pol like protein [Tanacetum cinerariifolium]